VIYDLPVSSFVPCKTKIIKHINTGDTGKRNWGLSTWLQEDEVNERPHFRSMVNFKKAL